VVGPSEAVEQGEGDAHGSRALHGVLLAIGGERTLDAGLGGRIGGGGQRAAGAGGADLGGPVGDECLDAAGLDGGVRQAGALLVEQDAAGALGERLGGGCLAHGI
jgi:hypothetical protein